jgi:hypothetical protein
MVSRRPASSGRLAFQPSTRASNPPRLRSTERPGSSTTCGCRSGCQPPPADVETPTRVNRYAKSLQAPTPPSPALRGRRRIERAVATRQVERSARRTAVDPDAPPVRPLPHLDHRNRVRCSPVAERYVTRVRARRRHLVVGLDPPVCVSAQSGLNPLRRSARTESLAPDPHPGGDMARGHASLPAKETTPEAS